MKYVITLVVVGVVLTGLFIFCALTHEDETFWLPEDKAEELKKRLNGEDD